MALGRRSCKNTPDVFCYICGEYNVVHNRKPVTTFIKRAYHAYFGMELGDQEIAWAPHMVCKRCIEYLRQWTKGKKSSLKFGIPMVWREPTNHATDCYFCAIEIPVPVCGDLPAISDEDSSTTEESEDVVFLSRCTTSYFPRGAK